MHAERCPRARKAEYDADDVAHQYGPMTQEQFEFAKLQQRLRLSVEEMSLLLAYMNEWVRALARVAASCLALTFAQQAGAPFDNKKQLNSLYAELPGNSALGPHLARPASASFIRTADSL